MWKFLSAVVVLASVQVVQAQVRVVDSTPQSVRSGAVRYQDTVQQRTEAYDQLQSLQNEVQELRGLVEEQAHQISILKQQQLDNYMDLDKRVSGMSSTKSAAPSSDSTLDATSPVAAPDPASMSEADEYKAAYDLLRNKQVDESLVAFKSYLNKYPQGEFAGNAAYWSGKIFVLKAQYPQAKDWFAKLLQNYPDSPKAPDAKFELGKTYFLLGDKKKSKATLEECALGTGESARLAKQYLKDNF